MSAGRQAGFTFVGVLILVATLGAVSAAFGEMSSHAAQREKERELLFAGDQYRRAIASYYRKEQRYPRNVDELLEDKRYPMPVRHLRKRYRDPVTGGHFALLPAPEGGIMGVASHSEEKPIKTGGFGLRDAAFAKATKYAEWQFVHMPPSPNGSGDAQARETAK